MSRVQPHQLETCAQCGFDFKKTTLRRQRGMLVCRKCYDKPPDIAPLDMKRYGPRANSTTVSAPSSPTVFSFGATGITAISQSQAQQRLVATKAFFMRVQSTGGAVNITANPQIVAGQNGDRLTLQGASSSATLTIENGDGVQLTGGTIVLAQDVVLNLVYSSAVSKWVETSRS